eukprot:TRINITY_DN20464_c0_g1_i1.p1 TRINITY_DN20464_c0_g1~~TRINITY_DN20464_c0_g1_i1.p1  ORF type:complete len:1032 (+),score=333.23 TRINITY_DN20464_c0_g1_i1:132-3227(+)
MAGWAQGACVRKLQQELREAGKEDFVISEGIHVYPHGDDLTHVEALIVGPDDTPYEGGFFHFDMRFPPEYPLYPPAVKLLTTDGGHVRFGPNLYADGKVCLSILGTWHEGPQWTAEHSMRSVLLSIQSLLCDNPYHNEPGFEGRERRPGEAARYAAMVRHETLRVAVAGMLENPTWAARPEVAAALTPAMQQNALRCYTWYALSLERLGARDGEDFNDPFGHMKSGKHDHRALRERLWRLGLLHDLSHPLPTVEISCHGRTLAVPHALPAPPGCGAAVPPTATARLLEAALGVPRPRVRPAAGGTVTGGTVTEQPDGSLLFPPGCRSAEVEGEPAHPPVAAAMEQAAAALAAAQEVWSEWQQSAQPAAPRAAGAGAAAARRLSLGSAGQEEEDEPKCRYCLCGEDDGDDPLVTPCKCKGDQRWCHVECLRRWQRSVLVQQPTHPQHHREDRRQSQCNVCKADFNVPPPSRAELMLSFSGAELAALLNVGCLIVTEKRTSQHMEHVLRHNAHIPQVLSVAHWVKGVYLITEIDSTSASDDSDLIVAVNLNGRSAPHVGPHGSHGCSYVCQVGGPCYQQMARVAAAVLSNTPHTELPPPSECGSARVWQGGMQGGLWAVGKVDAVAECAARDSARAAAAGAPAERPTVRVWAGDARWSRTQLLGELARGGWGMCRAEAADLIPKPTLWEDLINGDRLIYAPKNEMSEEFDDQGDDEDAPAEQSGGAGAAAAPAAEPKELREARERLAKDRLRRQLLDQQRKVHDEPSKRMKDEVVHWQRDPPAFVTLTTPPAEAESTRVWNISMEGPPGTPFEGGEYKAVIHFPSTYPNTAPQLTLATETGRLPVATPVPLPCLTQWNQRCSVATVAVQLVAALLEPGGAPDDEKRRFAALSATGKRRRSSQGAAGPAPRPKLDDLCTGERVRVRRSSGRPEAGRCGIIEDAPTAPGGAYAVAIAGGSTVRGVRRSEIEPTAFGIGHRVRIVGLQDRKELNGTPCRVVEALVEDYLAEAERYVVQGGDGTRWTVRRDCLEEEQ